MPVPCDNLAVVWASVASTNTACGASPCGMEERPLELGSKDCADLLDC